MPQVVCAGRCCRCFSVLGLQRSDGYLSTVLPSHLNSPQTCDALYILRVLLLLLHNSLCCRCHHADWQDSDTRVLAPALLLQAMEFSMDSVLKMPQHIDGIYAPAALHVVRHMLLGADGLHKANVMHRDIKLENCEYSGPGRGMVFCYTPRCRHSLSGGSASIVHTLVALLLSAYKRQWH